MTGIEGQQGEGPKPTVGPDLIADPPKAIEVTQTADKARRKGRLRAETEVLVRKYLEEHAPKNPTGIRRDEIAKAIGASAGAVSQSPAWMVYSERRNADARAAVREIPLTDAMLAVVPGDCQSPDELAALIEEQEEEEAEEIRRHKRRHDPS